VARRRRDEGDGRVPDELVLQTNLLGTDAMVRARLQAYQRAGVTTLRVEPGGEGLAASSPPWAACWTSFAALR